LFLKSQPPLILASTSTYRRDLLARLRLPFPAAPQGWTKPGAPASGLSPWCNDGEGQGFCPCALERPDAWVIGSDQVAVRIDGSADELILGKPGAQALCIEQLRGCSGRTVSFMNRGGPSCGGQTNRRALEFLDTTRVVFPHAR